MKKRKKPSRGKKKKNFGENDVKEEDLFGVRDLDAIP